MSLLLSSTYLAYNVVLIKWSVFSSFYFVDYEEGDNVDVSRSYTCYVETFDIYSNLAYQNFAGTSDFSWNDNI